MTTINERLKLYLTFKGIKHKEAARQCGINEQQFNNWCNNIKPSIDGLQRIVKNYSDLSARWLLTGDGEMLWVDEIKNQSNKFIDVIDQDGFQELLRKLDSDIAEIKRIMPINIKVAQEKMQRVI